MYSSKENVNILTSLLVAHGVRYAVVCPGSRNSAIVHNLNECPEIECYPVTDERSAGFYALGMAQVIHRPVAVCVTSGTALLNLAPAVAEAYYQHMPLIVISADRPAQWIDQLDGQTLPQADALGRFVKKAVNLPEVDNDEMHWYCNRLVNEALNETRHHGCGPVHINVPISEPLFEYTVEELPQERMIHLLTPRCNQSLISLECASQFAAAKKPMVVIGQLSTEDLIPQELFMLSQCAVVVHESLSVGKGGTNFDEVIHVLGDNPAYQPDFVLYLGDTLVSKRFKKWLRGLNDVHIWAVTEDGSIHDTSMQLYGVIEGSPAEVIEDLVNAIKFKAISSTATFKARWDQATRLAAYRAMKFQPEYSQMAAVKYLEDKLGKAIYRYIHYGNSSPIRLANLFAKHYVFCNRGVNGIDGSLSTAAGCSIVTGDEKVLCVLGDLSFFYDQNALWNQNLNGNLRIVVLNNGKGGIFNLLKGLENSPVRDKFVAAEHQTTAQGICKQNNVRYMKATNLEEMQQGIDSLLNKKSTRPVLLEIFTDAAEDERVIKTYYQILKNEKLANDQKL
ncbi:2-succinyl-5-enolpyruvyl-6-hydroxy-3-cyclohexene-1-carboxylic-acid synthase [Prevotella sp. P6B4]|uniref:2-succinyl-5-enolpyruvyl-6-hydroxy-3- cyclohexene-1-carboxylic-acid synthase n=1 Tax=Prevotella sp. P6B4 TaxID=1410614 RepID=UPI0004915512|nr:2-succinyl-5-enolpyruvyl-6-hydroxy-3-cyclohexene-1-carboxylic-acid synthase [Prevotella sp. P6B4]